MSVKPTEQVRKTQDKFPTYMGLNRDVFEFSHEAASEITRQLRNPGDILDLLARAIDEIQATDLPTEDVEKLTEMIEEEKNVISFSLGARGSVVGL
jgi:hypothetical protein